jgi:membrane-bound lytic murein transglycosylase D
MFVMRNKKQLIRLSWPALLLLALLAAPSVWAEKEEVPVSFPRPAELEHDVRFWTRVYSEITTNQGFIHDDWNLAVVYETLTFRPNISSRERNNIISQVKNRYRNIMLKLAQGNHDNLSAEEQRVLALWPADTARTEFRSASRRVRFQLGQADRFKQGLVRSGRWLPHIQQTLKEHGLPAEIAALPHVESSFNPEAYSFVGAAGIWQFTRSTGRRFMHVDHVADERMDPFLSTIAAARLLKHNYSTTNSWPLAITAYNHGLSGMRRAIDHTGGTDVVKVLREYKGRSFKFASRNFYVAFLAAIEVSSNVGKYFGAVTMDPPERTALVEVPDYMPATAVSGVLGIELEQLRAMNPALRKPIWSGDKYIPRGFTLRIPANLPLDPVVALSLIDQSQRFQHQLPDQMYTVQRGDSLSGIADRFSVRLSDLVAVNNLNKRNFIRVGQQLQLPRARSGRPTPSTVPSMVASATPAALVDGRYRVRRGDTLSRIATRYGVSEDTIVALNELPNRNSLQPGQWLTVTGTPATTEKPVLLASLQNAAASASATTADTTDALLKSAEKIPIAELHAAAEGNVEEAEPTTAEEAQGIAPAQPAGAHPALSSDPSDYSVDQTDNTIEIQVMETLGHYAEWLDVRAADLRKLNRLRYGKSLVIGARLKLDFSTVTPEQFEQRRTAYHRSLQEIYFAQYRIIGTKAHTIQRGESIWKLAEKRYNVPIWLLLQYNPDLKLNKIKPGYTVSFPLIEQKTEDG